MNTKYHIYCQGQRITSRNSPMELSPTQVKHYEMAGYRLKFDCISDEALATAKKIENLTDKHKDKCFCTRCVQFRVNTH